MKPRLFPLVFASLLLFAGAVFAQSLPPAPTNLVARIEHPGETEVMLTWQSAMGSYTFKIYRSLSDSTHFSPITTTTMRSYKDHGTVSGNTYFYYVTSLVVQGGNIIESLPSNIARMSLTGGTLSPKGTISGRVVSDSTGRGIPLVKIRFYHLSGPSMMEPQAFTDSLGFYLARLDTGRYLVKAEPMEGHHWNSPFIPEWYNNAPTPSTATPVRVLRDSVFAANFGLASRGTVAYAFVSGRVTDTLGVPLRNASVALMRTMQEMHFLSATTGMMPGLGEEMMEMEGAGHTRGVMWRGYTDSLGNYRARVITGNSYIAMASKFGYAPEYYNNKPNPILADIIVVTRDTSGINFSLSSNLVNLNSISGIVRDSSGTHVPSRIVLYPVRYTPGMHERFMHTDSLGAFTMTNVPAGKYFVFASPFSGYTPAFYKAGAFGIHRRQDADTVNITGNVTGVNVGVVPIGSTGYAHVGGTIHSSAGAPLAGVNLVATSSTGDVLGYGLSDGNGNYAIDAVATGSVTISVEREEYVPTAGNVNITSSTFSLNNVDFTLSPATPTGVTDRGTTPAAFALQQNYPNPFNPSTTIGFNIPASSRVSVKIFNLLGQEVVSLVNGELAAGTHAVLWNGKDNAARSVASGIYFYKLTATPSSGGQEVTQIRKMILMK